MGNTWMRGLATVCLLWAWGCQPAEEAPYAPTFSDHGRTRVTVYLFGVHPLHNPSRLSAVFSPLMDHLGGVVPGARFQLDASRNYPAYDRKLAERRHHFSLPNPYQTVQAQRVGYRVIAKMGDDDNFRGIILVRKDRGLTSVRDLAGQAISYPAPTALAATMMPQYYLQTHGLDVATEVESRYVGSQESSIMNVYLGATAAGATWPPPWRALAAERPELAEALEVKWQTEPLINNAVVVRDDVPPAVAAQVQAALVRLHESEAGRAILKGMTLSRFEAADDARYAVVTRFMADFAREVRAVP